VKFSSRELTTDKLLAISSLVLLVSLGLCGANFFFWTRFILSADSSARTHSVFVAATDLWYYQRFRVDRHNIGDWRFADGTGAEKFRPRPRPSER
jgi:hypothetical protein